MGMMSVTYSTPNFPAPDVDGSESGTLYRLGGDEFAFLSSGMTENTAVSKARKKYVIQSTSPTLSITRLSISPPVLVSLIQRLNDRLITYINLRRSRAVHEAKMKARVKLKFFPAVKDR